MNLKQEADSRSKKSSNLSLQRMGASEGQRTKAKADKTQDSQHRYEAPHGERGKGVREGSAASARRQLRREDRSKEPRPEPTQSALQHRSVASNSSVGRSTVKEDSRDVLPQKQLPKFVDPNQYQMLQQRAQRHL